MKYRHIVFDVDGTLVDNEYAILCSLCSTLLQLGRADISAEDLSFALGIPGEAALRRLGFSKPQEALRLWENEQERLALPVQLFEQIEGMLVALKEKGYRLGIVTSKTKEEYQKEVIPYGIDGFFDVCVFADMTKEHKPKAAPLLAYMNEAGAVPDEVLYIGDSPYDAQCAENAGVDFALAHWGNPKYTPIWADYHLARPEEVLRIV